MTYKPKFRVGVDWDGDGFTHLGGVAEGVAPSPLTNPLSPMLWSELLNEQLNDDSHVSILTDDPLGIALVTAKFESNHFGMEFFQNDPKQVWMPPLPEIVGAQWNWVSQDTHNIITDGTLITGDIDNLQTIGTHGSAEKDTDLVVNQIVLNDITVEMGFSPSSNYLDDDCATYGTMTGIFGQSDHQYISIDLGATYRPKIAKITVQNSNNQIYDPDQNHPTTDLRLRHSDTAWNGVEVNFGSNWGYIDDGIFDSTCELMTQVKNSVSQDRYWMLLAHSYTETIRISELHFWGVTETSYAQAIPINVTEDTALESFEFWAKADSASDDNLSTVELYTSVNSQPNTLLATGTKVNGWNSTYGWVNYAFTTKPVLEAGRQYFVVVTVDSVLHATRYFGTDSTKTGHLASTNGGSWINTTRLCYRIVGSVAPDSTWDGIGVIASAVGTTDLLAFFGGYYYVEYDRSIPVTAGVKYTAQFWVKYIHAQNEQVSDASLFVGLRNEDSVDSQWIFTHVWNADNDEVIAPNMWHKIAIEFTADKSEDVSMEVLLNGNWADDTTVRWAITGFMVYKAERTNVGYQPSWSYTETPESPTYSTYNLWTHSAPPTLLASSFNGGNDYFNTEDGEAGFWESASNPDTGNVEWLRVIQYETLSTTPRRFTIKVDDANNAPVDIDFGYFLNDAPNEVIINNFTGLSWTTGETKTFDIDYSPSNGWGFFIRFNSVQDGTSFVRIDEIFAYGATVEYVLPTSWVYPDFKSNLAKADETYYFNDLDANVQYRVGFYAKASGSTDWNYVLKDLKHGSEDFTDVTGTLSLTTSWQFIELTGGSAPSGSHSMLLSLVPDTGTPTIDIKGVAMYKTTDFYAIVAGDSAVYDRLDDYLLKMNWQLGTKDYYDTLAFEGTLMLELNNTSRIFSPANVDSPLFGELQQNRKVVVQVEDPSTNLWVTLWSGWTDTFDADVGTASKRKATIKCKQGIYRLREGSFSYLPKDDQTLDQVIEDLVNYSGWRSTAIPITWWINDNSILGVDTYLASQSDIWSQIDKGFEVYDLIGEGWNNKTKLESALKDMLEAEDATLWVTRAGHLFLASRYSKMYFGTADAVIEVGDLTNAKYSYGANLINQVEVHITPKEEVDEQIVWSNKKRIYVPRKRRGEDGKSPRLLLTFEYEEGGVKTVDNLQLVDKDVVKYVYTMPKKRRRKRKTNNVPTIITDEEILGKIKVKSYDDGEGRIYVWIESGHKRDVYVDLEIYGDVIKGGEGISYHYEDGAAIAQYEALHKKVIKSKILTEEGQALALATLRLNRDAVPAGEFKTLKLISENETLTTQILALTIGDIITLSEEQTGETSVQHLIIGEKATVKDGVLFMVYTIARLPQQEYNDLTGLFDGNSKFTI